MSNEDFFCRYLFTSLCVPCMHTKYCYMQSLFEQANQDVVCLAMKVMGAYVSWIDISLIASEKCMRYDNFVS